MQGKIQQNHKNVHDSDKYQYSYLWKGKDGTIIGKLFTMNFNSICGDFLKSGGVCQSLCFSLHHFVCLREFFKKNKRLQNNENLLEIKKICSTQNFKLNRRVGIEGKTNLP